TIEDQLPDGPLDTRMQREGAVGRVADPGFDGFELGMLEQLAGISSKKWWGTTVHLNAIKPFPARSTRSFRSRVSAMSSHSPSSVHLRDLTHPVVAGVISVIVTFVGTFTLVFEAARAAGLSPVSTASWVW